MSTKTMQDIIDTTIGIEGRYCWDPNDIGGETMWGITVKVARANGYTGRMCDLPRDKAVQIFTQEYYVKPKYDQVHTRSALIAEELFDTGVNQGVQRSSTYLQVALNAFNRGGSMYPDISEDGAIGPGTLAALDAYLQRRGVDAVVVMLRALNSQQGARYLELARLRMPNEEFEYGWFLNRVVI